MEFWKLFEWAAWIVSAALLLYILIDTIRVGMEYDEELLLSSREGVDELLEGHKDE